MDALLISSDAEEHAVLHFVLQRVGFSVRSTREMERALHSLESQSPDLALLATTKASAPIHVAPIRSKIDAPLVIVSDALEESAQAALLELGADLVVIRPFSARLLIAQIRAIMRRTGGPASFGLRELNLGGVSLDPGLRTVRVDGGEAARLTQLEFRLLYTLMRHAGQVMPADQLVEHVWGYSGQGDRDLVRGLIKRVRSKIEPQPSEPRYIITMAGVGYVFEA